MNNNKKRQEERRKKGRWGKKREKEREGGTDTEGRERTQKVNVPKVWDLLPWESPSQEKVPCPLTNLEAK